MVGDSLIHNFFRDNMVPYLSRFKCSIPTNSVKYCSQVPVSIINYICTQRADSALYSGTVVPRRREKKLSYPESLVHGSTPSWSHKPLSLRQASSRGMALFGSHKFLTLLALKKFYMHKVLNKIYL